MVDNTDRARAALTVLCRLGDREQDVHPWIRRLMLSNPEVVLPAALAVAVETADPIPATPNAINRVINQVLWEVDLPDSLLQDLRRSIHPDTTALAETHAIITARLLTSKGLRDSQTMASLRTEYAERLLEIGNHRGAHREIKRAKRVAKRAGLMNTPLGLEVLRVQSRCEQRLQRFRRAQRTAWAAVRRAARLPEPNDPNQLLQALVTLGNRYLHSGKDRKAAAVFRDVVEIAQPLIQDLSRDRTTGMIPQILEASAATEETVEEPLTEADLAVFFRYVRRGAERNLAFAQAGLAEALVDLHDPEAVTWAKLALRTFDDWHAESADQHRLHVARIVYCAKDALELLPAVPDDLLEFAQEIDGRIEEALWDLLQIVIARSDWSSMVSVLGRLCLIHRDDGPDDRWDFVDRLNRFGLAVRHDQRPADAAQVLSIAVELASDPEPDSFHGLFMQAATLASLSQAFDDLGDKRAVRTAQQACDVAEAAQRLQAQLSERSTDGVDEPGCALMLGSVYNGLSIRLEHRRKFNEAFEAQLRSVREYERCYAPDRPDLVFSAVTTVFRLFELANSLGRLEYVVDEVGRFARRIVETYPGHREEIDDVVVAIGELLEQQDPVVGQP